MEINSKGFSARNYTVVTATTLQLQTLQMSHDIHVTHGTHVTHVTRECQCLHSVVTLSVGQTETVYREIMHFHFGTLFFL